MARQLLIDEDQLISRIAWYESRNRRKEAIALRQLAADCQPPYQVDEARVLLEIYHLRRLSYRK